MPKLIQHYTFLATTTSKEGLLRHFVPRNDC